MIKGGTFAEVGVFKGNFSRQIIDLCKPSKIYLIDNNIYKNKINEKFRSEIYSGLIIPCDGNSSTILNKLPNNQFDFIYIDADHTYEGVKMDIEAAKNKVKMEGSLIFNDYTYWSPAECMPYGVIQAVNELCIEEDWEMKYFSLAHHML